MAKALQKEFSLISNFKLGYRNKEDISTLPPYVLSIGSQNVLTNNAEQVVVRNGYQLDGPASTQNTYGIDSGFDFNTHVDGIRNLRKWGTNLQVRYVNPSANLVSWITIKSDMNAGNVCNCTEYWDISMLKNILLFVNGDRNVYRWSGGMGSFASATSTTITLEGTQTLANLNFDSSGNLLIDGVTYSYTSNGNTNNTIYTHNDTNETILVSSTVKYASQIFTTGANIHNLTGVTSHVQFLAGFPLPITFTCSIYTDNAGVPGTLIVSSQYAVPNVSVSGTRDINFIFSQGLSPATNYHIVLTADNNSNFINFYTGNTGSVGTNISLDAISWTPHDGFLYATITENDSNTETFTGVTPDPTLAGIVVGDAVIQTPSIGSSNVTGVSGFDSYDLIGTFRNQAYYGSFSNQTVFISKVNDYTDTTFATPRIVGEGANVTLDAPPTAFISQIDGEYMSAGLNFWYRTKFTLSADLSSEAFEIDRLKTSSNQGAVSQSYVSKFKNSIVYISFEPIFNALGPVKNILADAQVVNMSDGIRNDMDAYTFSGGSIHYFNYDIYFSVPQNNVVRIYNVNNKYWEAPQTMPVGIFYEVNGQLYGHDATTDQSYQLFVPNLYRDNEAPINAIAAFPYVSSEGAQPNQLKFFNKHYTEGYIAGNTTLTLQFNYDFGAFSGTYSVGIKGSDKRIVFNKLTDGSLGTNTLGNQPIGTILNLPNQPPIPKFRVVNTFPPTNAYEVQTIYSSYDLDANWAILRFGPAIGPARDTQAAIQE